MTGLGERRVADNQVESAILKLGMGCAQVLTQDFTFGSGLGKIVTATFSGQRIDLHAKKRAGQAPVVKQYRDNPAARTQIGYWA